MPDQDLTVTVRMYNVGFGDAFLVTVTDGDRAWRMLVDCGAHSQGLARPIRESVDTIIAHLKEVAPDDQPHLDVVVATHHHADHISGFAVPAWEQVVVDEVWLPFVEDATDPDAKMLRQAQTGTAQALLGLINRRTQGLEASRWPADVRAAQSFALNSMGNAAATDRLVGRNGQHFATPHRVRYLPSSDEAQNVIQVGLAHVTAHVLSPPRHGDELKLMNPPAKAGWLQLDPGGSLSDDDSPKELFNLAFIVGDEGGLSDTLIKAQRALRLGAVTNDEGVLAAATILERAVNNTSIFLVLDVNGTRLIFPGDAQYGSWEHVLNNPAKRELLVDAAFYKIGHHGSHNATPKSFVDEIWHDGAYAMLPWGLVKRWQDTIPKRELMDALQLHHHTVVRADAAVPVPNKVTVHDDLWSEIVFAPG